jgi:transposase
MRNSGSSGPRCGECGAPAWVKDRPVVELVDLACFGVRPGWCGTSTAGAARRRCVRRSWTRQDPAAAAARLTMTDRAGRWATAQVGRHGRTVNEIARELGCDWHTVNDAVTAYATPLVEDPDRIGQVTAVGLDEVLFARQGRWRTHPWSTSIADVATGQLLDLIEGRSAVGACRWFTLRPPGWCEQIAWAVLDLSGPWRLTFDTVLPWAIQLPDPFHLIKLANQRLDEVRRRVQNDTLGHRGRKHDPLYRSRRLLTRADERLDDRGRRKLLGLLDACDPHGEVRTAWHAKEVVRSIYDHHDPDLALEFIARLGANLQDDSCPPEVCPLGHTHRPLAPPDRCLAPGHVSNGPTEAVNNLIKKTSSRHTDGGPMSSARVGEPGWLLDGR